MFSSKTTFLSNVGDQILNRVCEYAIPSLGGEEPMEMRQKIIKAFTPGDTLSEEVREVYSEDDREVDLSVLYETGLLYPRIIVLKSAPPVDNGEPVPWLAHVDEVVFTEMDAEEGLLPTQAAVETTIQHLVGVTGVTINPGMPSDLLQGLFAAFSPKPVESLCGGLAGGLEYAILYAEQLYRDLDVNGYPANFIELPKLMKELKVVAVKTDQKVVAGIVKHYMERQREKYYKLEMQFVLQADPETFLEKLCASEFTRPDGRQTFALIPDSRGCSHDVARLVE